MKKPRDVIPLRRPLEDAPERWGLYSFRNGGWLAGDYRTHRQADSAASRAEQTNDEVENT